MVCNVILIYVNHCFPEKCQISFFQITLFFLRKKMFLWFFWYSVYFSLCHGFQVSFTFLLFYEDCRFSWIFIIENRFWSIKFWILKKKKQTIVPNTWVWNKELKPQTFGFLAWILYRWVTRTPLWTKPFQDSNMPCVSFPFTPWHQYAYSPYCSLYIFSGADKENFLNDQELLLFLITSSILVTVIQDPRMIL